MYNSTGTAHPNRHSSQKYSVANTRPPSRWPTPRKISTSSRRQLQTVLSTSSPTTHSQPFAQAPHYFPHPASRFFGPSPPPAYSSTLPFQTYVGQQQGHGSGYIHTPTVSVLALPVHASACNVAPQYYYPMYPPSTSQQVTVYPKRKKRPKKGYF
jgi:hypothetical protein